MKIANKISISFLITAVILTTITVVALYISLSGMLKGVIFNNLVTATEFQAKHIMTYLNANRYAAVQLSKSVVINKLLTTSFKDQEYFFYFNDVAKRLEDTLEARRNAMSVHPRHSRTYWWVWAEYDGEPHVLGAFHREREAEERGMAKFNCPFEVVELDTKDMAEAKRRLKAIALERTSNLPYAMRPMRQVKGT